LSEGYTGKWANVYTIADLAFSVRSKNYNMTISSAADLVGHTLNANYPVGETTYSTGTVVTEEIAQAIYGAGTTKVAVKDDRVFTASNVSAETAETYRAYGFKYWSQKKLATGIKSYVDTTAMTEDATANATSLATFSSTYWTVTNGIPTWANIPAAE
ncbi:MAG: hypothetical protein IJW47_01465, partial [Clostridia bacterium]|nr:hypothetical protein [Clostridia bacterium]